LRPIRCRLRISVKLRRRPCRNPHANDDARESDRSSLRSAQFLRNAPSRQNNRQRGGWFHVPARKKRPRKTRPRPENRKKLKRGQEKRRPEPQTNQQMINEPLQRKALFRFFGQRPAFFGQPFV